ncbi:MAG: molybdopterin biosynthesis protein [Anaerolineaceae bacterium]|nr:molybdopterin biosynthesis protein [Anaerolineaceae bacterium]
MYLHDIPLAEARARFHQALVEIAASGLLGEEEIDLDENALGRVLSRAVTATRCSPHFHASAMDGYAVRAVETLNAGPTQPVTLVVGEQALYCDTGDPIPVWADAVIPIEVIESLDEQGQISAPSEVRKAARIRIRAAVTGWTHIRPMGEDIVTSQLILAAGTSVRPADLGAAAAGGACKLFVARKPRVGILPTGSELVKIGQTPDTGELTEFNSVVLAAMVQEWGGLARRYAIVADDYEAICLALQTAAAECDLVLINAGSSAGSEDFTSQAVERLGKLLVHGVAMRPGHPVVIGLLKCETVRQDGRKWIPVIGVPGYPVSAALTAEIFVQPLLSEWLGIPQSEGIIQVDATLTRKVNSPAGDDDYLRVVLGYVENNLLAAPLSRGAGVTTSLSKADGILVIPRMTQGFEAGSRVKVRLYRHEEELHRTILTIGSHDLTLDILAQYLAPYERRLVSANAGSLGGLLALQRHEAHFAGSHLLDVETGEYNLSYIHQYLPGVPLRVFGWVERVQGMLVQKGNPKGIQGISDLARADVRLVNRQRGSGTRNLLDHWLIKSGILPETVCGYDVEEFTHLGVAAAVVSGRADCGLAIQASAQILDLDFIPLFEESYQLVVPETSVQDPLLSPLFDLMQEPRLKEAILSMPGYKVDRMGCTLARF